jgi:hypothetical protein
MIKRYRCSNCSQSFEKYIAPFEKFNTVECITCKGTAREVFTPKIHVQIREEPFLGSDKHVMAELINLANE